MRSREAPEFGQRLAEERRRLGLTQAELALRVGIDAPRQSLYETGIRSLKAAYLASLAAVGIDLSYVLTGQRALPSSMPPLSADLLHAYAALPPDLQLIIARLVGDAAAALVPAERKRKRGRPKRRPETGG